MQCSHPAISPTETYNASCIMRVGAGGPTDRIGFLSRRGFLCLQLHHKRHLVRR